jgi:hypothetical protein
MPICERLVCQKSKRTHRPHGHATSGVLEREMVRSEAEPGGARSWMRQASSEKTQYQRAARARPRPRGAPWTRAGRPHAPAASQTAARGGRRRHGAQSRPPRASAATGEFARRGAARAADGPDYRLTPAAPDGAGCGDPTVRVLSSPVLAGPAPGSGAGGPTPPPQVRLTVEVRYAVDEDLIMVMRLCVTH